MAMLCIYPQPTSLSYKAVMAAQTLCLLKKFLFLHYDVHVPQAKLHVCMYIFLSSKQNKKVHQIHCGAAIQCHTHTGYKHKLMMIKAEQNYINTWKITHLIVYLYSVATRVNMYCPSDSQLKQQYELFRNIFTIVHTHIIN